MMRRVGMLLPLACAALSLFALGCDEKPTEPVVAAACVESEWRIRAPADSSTIQAGSAVTVEFCYRQGVTAAGLKWYRGLAEGVIINTLKSITPPTDSYVWNVPDTLAGDTIKLRVHKYGVDSDRSVITLFVK